MFKKRKQMLTYEKIKDYFLLFYKEDEVKNNIDFKRLSRYCECDFITLIDKVVENGISYVLRDYVITDYETATITEGQTLSTLTEEDTVKICDLINTIFVTSKLSNKKILNDTSNDYTDVTDMSIDKFTDFDDLLA